MVQQIPWVFLSLLSFLMPVVHLEGLSTTTSGLEALDYCDTDATLIDVSQATTLMTQRRAPNNSISCESCSFQTLLFFFLFLLNLNS
ncbi:hypothetical protein BD408DRAFT_133027 [Parasitella parasitica]|nr:hypothetical protein BD408DRAFT_133027 [Parasitella parasitica]